MRLRMELSVKFLLVFALVYVVYHYKVKHFFEMGLHEPFWSGHNRIRSRYKFAYMYPSYGEKILTEEEGRRLFVDKCQMSNCVVTSDDSFMPIRHYDALLFSKHLGYVKANDYPQHLKKQQFWWMASPECLSSHYQTCTDGPKMVGVHHDNKKEYDLCSFCQMMWKKT